MKTLIAVLVGLSIGVTSIAMQSGMGGRLPNGDVFGPGGLYTENSDGSITPKGGEGGYNGAGDILPLSVTTVGTSGGSGGGDTMWTETIRRENDDGTYYYVYKDHGSASVVYTTGSKK